MKAKNETQFSKLQMVEIDQNKFAVQLSDSNVSVNLTKMAKPFGKAKQPSNWLKTTEAKEYIENLSVHTKVGTTDLLIVKQGGLSDEQGTWANDYRIAMRFAQWLSSDFSIQVDEMLVNMLVYKKMPEPKQLTTNATDYKEETIITVKMGQYTNQIYITNGVIWARLAPICKYLGYNITSGSVLISKLGEENCKQILAGKWFINVNAFDRLLSVVNKTIQSAVMSSIYKDVFGIGRPMDEYVYHYTAPQMLNIYDTIMKAPINKETVINALRKGKI